MNAIVKRWQGIPLILRILVGLILGAVLGAVAPNLTILTILGDIFSMTMIVAIADDSDVFNSLQENLKTTGEDLGVQTVLQREDVFQYMYKI